MEDIKESKKILTDYMLELNADIQRAEDWVNTSADEEMYFALKTVLDRLEQLEKENKEVHLAYSMYKDMYENSVYKPKIRTKLEEVKMSLEVASTMRANAKTQEEESVLWCIEIRLDEKVKTLQELLGGSNE